MGYMFNRVQLSEIIIKQYNAFCCSKSPIDFTENSHDFSENQGVLEESGFEFVISRSAVQIRFPAPVKSRGYGLP